MQEPTGEIAKNHENLRTRDKVKERISQFTSAVRPRKRSTTPQLRTDEEAQAHTVRTALRQESERVSNNGEPASLEPIFMEQIKDERKDSPLPRELPSRELLEKYAPKDEWFLEQKQTTNTVHDKGHLMRTLIFAELITEKLLQDNPDLQIDREAVRWAAVAHDTQRTSDYEIDQKPHGVRAEIWTRSYGLKKEHPELSAETIDLVSKICKFHTPGYKDAEFPDPYPIELKIVQDADTLEAERGAIQASKKARRKGQEILRKLPPQMAGIVDRFVGKGMRSGGGVNRLIQRRVKNHYHGTLRIEAANDFFPAARELVTTSMKDYNQYCNDPVGTVLNAGEQLGLVKAA